MRHRSPRPIFDVFGRPSSRSVRRAGIAASALALLGTASAVALAVQGDPVSSAQDRTMAKVGGTPASHGASTVSDPTPGRTASPSRSDEREHLDGVAPSPLLPREQSGSPSHAAALLTHRPSPSEASTTAAAAGSSASSTPSTTDAPSPSATGRPLVTTPSQVPTVGSSPNAPRLTKLPTRTPSPTPKSTAPTSSSTGSTPWSETSASDTTAPDTTMATLSTDEADWTVTVDADEPAAFECSLDGARFEPCASSATFSGLGSGWHTLEARATDAAGNTDASPAEVSVKLAGAQDWQSGH